MEEKLNIAYLFYQKLIQCGDNDEWSKFYYKCSLGLTIEEYFNITMTDEEYFNTETLEDICKLIESKLCKTK